MRVGKPTAAIPRRARIRGCSKYDPVYKQIDALPNGDFLPVTFETKREAHNFYLAAITHRTRLLEAAMRGATIYVRNKRCEGESA